MLTLADLATQLPDTLQVVWVVAAQPSSATIRLFERSGASWKQVGPDLPAAIGYKGFAALDRKVEGDKKTPSGLFAIDSAFGYSPTLVAKMPYRTCTPEDKFVDDPDSPQYNTWVHGDIQAKSFETMRRSDPLYELGLIIRYNMDPIIKGKGSAIFFHVWSHPQATTAGCVALSLKDLIAVIRWLDPAKHPYAVMNPESL